MSDLQEMLREEELYGETGNKKHHKKLKPRKQKQRIQQKQERLLSKSSEKPVKPVKNKAPTTKIYDFSGC